jgi:hypothetical protein
VAVRLLPSRAFVVETALSPEEVLRRLGEAVEAPVFRHGKQMMPSFKRPFVGAVNGDAFAVERATAQRAGFLPVVVGRVAADDGAGGARVVGRIRMRYPGMAFLAVWFGGLLVGAGVLGARAVAAGRFDPLVLAPLGMIALGVALTVVGFVPETRRALDALAKVVKATRAALE